MGVPSSPGNAVGQPAVLNHIFTILLQRLQRFDASLQDSRVLGIAGENHVGKVQSLQRFAVRHSFERKLYDGLRPSGKLHQIRVDRRGRQGVHRRRIRVKPPRISIIDSANRPADLSKDFTQVVLLWQLDLLHQREHILSVVHSLHHFIVHVLHSVPVTRQTPRDFRVPTVQLSPCAGEFKPL